MAKGENELSKAPWRAVIWDRPQGAVRYCIRRADPNAYDGWEYATDTRDGVAVFSSIRAAETHAEHLGAKERARAAQEAQGDG